MTSSDNSSKRRVRILHLIPADGIGGVEIAAKSMLARPDLQCDFRLYFIESGSAAKRTWSRYWSVIRSNWRALRDIRSFETDIILCSLWRSVPLALLVRAFHRQSKLVYMVHSNATAHIYDSIMSKIAMWASVEIWGDSSEVLISRGVPIERSRSISFVIERTYISEKNFMGPRFVSWGRLDRLKGFDRSIGFVKLLAQQGIDVSYDIYGPDDGELRALVELTERLGLSDRVRFPGALSRDDLAATAARYSFFLQLSRSEGMCMAAVEAMQLGLVPVTTAVGQMKHYVVPGQTGILADPQMLQKTASEVTALINDPGLWDVRSKSAAGSWREAPLYADDVCRSATALLRR